MLDQQSWKNRIPLLLFEAIFFIICAIIVILVQKNHIYTKSGDLAEHYAFAQDITDTWQWPTGDKPFTSGMVSYPPLAHYLAAILGLALGSPLMAINIISIFCVFGCYFLLAEAISAGSPRGSLAAAAIAAMGVLAARTQHAALGFEIDFNFFYAQLVGEFVFFLFVFWLSRTRVDWKGRLLVSVIVAGIGAWLYMTVSLEIVVAYVGMEGILLLRKIRDTRTLSWAWVLPAAFGALILPLTIIFHPALRGMVNIASNNGELDVLKLDHLVPAFAACLFVVAFALGILAPDSPRWRNATFFLVIASCATAVVALLQFGAQTFAHLGSDYAVKKFAFCVSTLLAFTIGAAVATLMEVKSPSPNNLGLTIFLSTAFAAIATLGMHVYPAEQLNKFIAYENEIKAAMASKTTPPDAMGHTSSRNPAFGYPLNHAATLVDLRMATADSLKAIDAELDPSVTGPEAYSFVDDRLKSTPRSCTIGPNLPDGMVLVSLECERTTFSTIKLGQRVDLSASPDRPPYFKSGWGIKEPGAIWSAGHNATLAMRVDQVTGPIVVTVDALAFLPAPGYVQHVVVSVNGTPLTTWTYDDSTSPGTRTVVVPASLVKDGRLALDLSLPDATSPLDHRMSPDGRKLAIYVSAFAVSAEYPLINSGETISLANAAATPPYFKSGWGAKEPGAIWSAGHDATLAMGVGQVLGPLVVSVDASAFLPAPSYVQHVGVSVNGKSLTTWTYDSATPSGTRTIVVPAALVKDGGLKLDLSLPDATSPIEHNLGADGRKLGIYVSALAVSAQYPQIKLGETISLANTPTTPPYFIDGWSAKEPTAVWSDGPTASLSMHVDKGGGPVNIAIGAMTFLPKPSYVQHVEVRVGKTLVGTWRYDAQSRSGIRTVTIPGRLNKTGDIRLDLRFPDAISPAATHLSQDPRRLGLYVSSIAVKPQ